MTVFKLAGIAVLSVTAGIVLRTYRPDMALQLSMAVCAVLLLFAIEDIAAIRGAIEDVCARYGFQSAHLKLIFKVIGIAYMAQFASETCRDAGESAVASKVELVGRVLILGAALPALLAVLGLLSGLLATV
ncbi:MAG: stage III sporulation protein AD [Christensenellaceae bacterium]|jgi:stage III sporulation protein AD|nr:stage III sporulation protein AD [Christensenellaceae bacterium]